MGELNKDKVDRMLKQIQDALKQVEKDFDVKVAFRQITFTSERLAGRIHIYADKVVPLTCERPPVTPAVKDETPEDEPKLNVPTAEYDFKKDWHRALFVAFTAFLPAGTTSFTTEDINRFIASQAEYKMPYWYTLDNSRKISRGRWIMPKV